MTILGFDPGRDKTGFAFINNSGSLLASGIFPTQDQQAIFTALLPPSSYDTLSQFLLEGSITSLTSPLDFIAIGSGTHSKAFTENARAALPFEILTVDEKNTTLEARRLYWTLHKPGLFTRLLPEGLRVPKRILDDLAAWAIALRGLKKYRDIRRNKL